MQLLCVSVALSGLVVQFVRAEAIIGFDGKEHDYRPHTHRDGLHDHALHEIVHPRRHDLSHPRLRRWDGGHLHHMLNQAPIIVSQQNLRIATNSRHIKRGGTGVATPPSTLAATAGNATHESATGLNRMEKNMVDAVSEHTVEEDKHAAKRDQNFHFRRGHEQTEKNAAEDLTAEEVQRGARERGDKDKVKVKFAVAKTQGLAPSAAAPGAAPAPAASPAAAPGASPAAAPSSPEEKKEETNNMFSMQEDLGAQEQGFSGDLVQHDDMKTMTKDWRGEYGPGQSSYKRICQQYPDNQWCRDRGYHQSTPPPKSGAVRASAGLLICSLLWLLS